MTENNLDIKYDDNYANQINNIINTLKLDSDTDKNILKSRFLSEVVQYEKRKLHTKKYYDLFRFIVTTGSILLPAILSLGQMDPAKLPKHFDQWTYWASWTISLMVTASNGFLQLFSLDKNYFEYALTTEQLKTEGWQYFQLSGKYNDSPDHETAFKFFCKSVENIKKKQIEQEFSGGKAGDKKTYDFDKEMKNNLDKFKIKDKLDDEKKKLIKDRKKKEKEEEKEEEEKDKIEEGEGPNITGEIAE